MDHLEREIRELLAKTAQNRRDFLAVEVQTCTIAVERACLELSLGNTDEARKEEAIATRGVQVIERFLGEASEPLDEIRAKVTELKRDLESLRQQIQSYPT